MKAPTFPFYASDFMMDTLLWPEDEIGAWIRMLSYLWIHGPCKKESLAALSKSGHKVLVRVEEKLITYDDGTISSQKLEESRAYYYKKSKRARDMANKRWNKVRTEKEQKTKGDQQDHSLMPTHCQSNAIKENENEIENEIENEKGNEKKFDVKSPSKILFSDYVDDPDNPLPPLEIFQLPCFQHRYESIRQRCGVLDKERFDFMAKQFHLKQVSEGQYYPLNYKSLNAVFALLEKWVNSWVSREREKSTKRNKANFRTQTSINYGKYRSKANQSKP